VIDKSKLQRLTEWWRPKAGTIFSLLLFYLTLWDVPFSEGWRLLVFSFITITGFGITGYFLNDWADIPFDRKASKTNLVDSIAIIWRPFILLGLLGVTLMPWLCYFKTDSWSIGLIITQFVLQIAYPIPPIRIKRFPIVAIITDALYAFVIPSILAWHTFDISSNFNYNQGQYSHYVFLFLWMFALGVRHILSHHVVDRFNDEKTETPNLANQIAPLSIKRFTERFLFPVELLGSVAFFVSLLRFSEHLVLGIVLVILFFGFKHFRGILPFFEVPFSGTSLDKFNAFYLGAISSFSLLVFEKEYAAVLLCFIVLFSELGRRGSIPFKVASYMFNWSLYFFRKYVLRWSEERNFGEYYPARLLVLEERKRKKRGVVAVFNQNEGKYTETFVRGHLKNLPFHVVFFYGWPSPIFVGSSNEKASGLGFKEQVIRVIRRKLSLESYQQDDALIISKLGRNDVRLILAEFGTMGARLVQVSKATGIPLVPIFYGYDAWQKETLSENKEAYVSLFEIAPLVIGVSNDICEQLERLGCPENKIEYLPCFVDLSRFQYVQREFVQPNFLTVGRFCNSKAPFLTILAFNEVIKRVPLAKLTMVGGDENGVLETCKSLVKSLDLEGNILILDALSPDEVHEQMVQASIFVQHSITTPVTGDKEGTPVAIMEAMATGLPVISTKHAGIAEIIENGVSGILVDEFAYKTMSEEMIRLVVNVEGMKNMGKKASEAIYSNSYLTDNVDHLTQKLERYIV